MTDNLLVNGSFELDWTDIPIPGIGTINQEPDGWEVEWLEPGDPLLSSVDYGGPDDEPHYLTAKTIPECCHKLNDQLPPDEQSGGVDAIVLDGDTAYKVFSSVNPFGAYMAQLVTGLDPGRRIVLEVPVRVHHHGDGSPGAAVWRCCLNNQTGPWLTFKEDFDDRAYMTFGMDSVVDADGCAFVAIDLESRALAGIDFFVDDVRLRYLDNDPEEPGSPTPSECRGTPREQYVRVVNVVPADVEPDRYLDIAEIVWERSRETVTGSYDDAGLGDLDDKTAVLWDIPEGDWPIFREWYAEHYPDVKVRFAGAGAESPPTPGPEPPVVPPVVPPTQEPQYTLRGGGKNLIGLHSGFTKAQSFPYILNSGTTIQKFFSAGDAYEAARIAPGIVSVWRRYVGNEQGRIWEKPTIRESARWYLDQYTAEIETARTNMGLTLAQFLARKLALESLNETIPSFNTPVVAASVEFDVEFCDLAHERYGSAINTVLLCGAIGNPHESEVPLLLPAAKAAYKHGDFLGYHCYWTANEGQQFIENHWPYHAGRWMEWDTYFRSQGVYPRYASGEIGIVYAWDGVSFNSGLGWKRCGSFERYLEDIDTFNSKCLAWNKLHGNRFAGGTIFAYGQWGWDNFVLGDGEVILLNKWAQAL